MRALHSTMFNLGGAGPYDRATLVQATNELIQRYDLAWINKDLGIWSLGGCQVPYPSPPYPTDEGLDTAIFNTRGVQYRLDAPLLVEFPGVARENTLFDGPWHAYDYFREVVEQAGCAATLDTGHLLSYQWARGSRGEELFGELNRLPLQACFEIHLSGCQIVGDRFIDAHHGVLLDEQLRLLQVLMPLCPNLRAITCEDTRFDAVDELIPRGQMSWAALVKVVAAWRPLPPVQTPPIEVRSANNTLVEPERALTRVLRQGGDANSLAVELGRPRPAVFRALSERLARDLMVSSHTGCGSSQRAYPQTLERWRLEHPHDADLHALARLLCASEPAQRYVELAVGPSGVCLEHAFYLFCVDAEVAELAVVEEEL